MKRKDEHLRAELGFVAFPSIAGLVHAPTVLIPPAAHIIHAWLLAHRAAAFSVAIKHSVRKDEHLRAELGLVAFPPVAGLVHAATVLTPPAAHISHALMLAGQHI